MKRLWRGWRDAEGTLKWYWKCLGIMGSFMFVRRGVRNGRASIVTWKPLGWVLDAPGFHRTAGWENNRFGVKGEQLACRRFLRSAFASLKDSESWPSDFDFLPDLFRLPLHQVVRRSLLVPHLQDSKMLRIAVKDSEMWKIEKCLSDTQDHQQQYRLNVRMKALEKNLNHNVHSWSAIYQATATK